MTREPIAELFLKKVKELGLDTKQFRRINRLQEEKQTGYIIRVYGFAPEETLDGEIHYDFHVIRREPDGKWVHKSGFFYRPREISHGDWMAIFEKYGNKFVSFALDAQ